MAQTNPPFMSGVPELLILRLLIRQQMYGYELVRAIRSSTGDVRAIRSRGTLKARRKSVNGRNRVYYAVTAKGKRRLTSLTEEWQRVTGGVRTALEEPGRA